MQSKFLLPHIFRRIGWILIIPFTVLGLFSLNQEFEFSWLDYSREHSLWDFYDDNWTNKLAAIGVLMALLFIAFAREKIGDEYIMKLRLDSLLVAVFINYALLFLAVVLVYGTAFFSILVYNMYTILIIFIARFYWVKWRQQKMIS